MDHSQIFPNLFVGSCPETESDIHELKRAGITGILTLQTEEDYAFLNLDWPQLQAAHFALGMDVRHVPIRDFSPTELEQRLPGAVDVLNGMLEEGHVVFVHCNSGLNRSPTTVAAYLHWSLGWTLEKAEGHIRSRRASAPDVGLIQRASRDRE